MTKSDMNRKKFMSHCYMYTCVVREHISCAIRCAQCTAKRRCTSSGRFSFRMNQMGAPNTGGPRRESADTKTRERVHAYEDAHLHALPLRAVTRRACVCFTRLKVFKTFVRRNAQLLSYVYSSTLSRRPEHILLDRIVVRLMYHVSPKSKM